MKKSNAALLSAKGGSFYILRTYRDSFVFVMNEYVFGEVQEVIEKKLKRPELRRFLFLLVGSVPIRILPDSNARYVKSAEHVINAKDAPVLASALEHGSYLLTLDNDFLDVKVKEFARTRNVTVYTPREFIKSV